MQELNEFMIMIDLEFLGKDEPDAQILDIGICCGTSPDNLEHFSFKPAWQEEGIVQPETLKFWAGLNPGKLCQYMDNNVPMVWVAQELYLRLQQLAREAHILGKPVIVISKGITHDLPKLEYHIENEVYPRPVAQGFGVFETLFGYNCRRDMRSFSMYRNPKDKEEARAYGASMANSLCEGETLHDAEWDAISQWCEVYRLALGADAIATTTCTVRN